MTYEESLKGKVFGMMTIIDFVKRDKHNNIYVLCECVCGVKKQVCLGGLRSGSQKSCGCYSRELARTRSTHGECKSGIVSPEYKAWQNMKNRCSNVKLKCYPDGGRGITVCSEWIDDFDRFVSDVGRRPTSRHSFDRINNNLNYELGNIRWATKKQQVENRRNARRYLYDGIEMDMSDWARKLHVAPNTIHHHLKTKTFDEMMTFYKNKKSKQPM